MWFDNWCSLGPLCSFISNRNLYEVNLQHNATVADMVINGNWKWPDHWVAMWPQLEEIQNPPVFSANDDKLVWRSN